MDAFVGLLERLLVLLLPDGAKFEGHLDAVEVLGEACRVGFVFPCIGEEARVFGGEALEPVIHL